MGSVLYTFSIVQFFPERGRLFAISPNPKVILTQNFHQNTTRNHQRFSTIQRLFSHLNLRNYAEEEEADGSVQDLRLPTHWLEPSKALEESEWLRVTLHKWLDDEYCPEETNIEISKIAARSYYKSLVERETDIGEILLQMVRELQSISYQESFHGAFSSANAAVNLIIQRIDRTQ